MWKGTVEERAVIEEISKDLVTHLTQPVERD